MTFFKTHKHTIFLTTLLVIGAFYCSGCSNKKNPVVPNGDNLVCEDGEAWIKTTDGVEGGYIFRPNGDMIAVAALYDGSWHGTKVGTYSTDGNKLTTVFTGGGTDTTTYKVADGKLTLSGGAGSDVYTKKSGVYVK